jgi:xylulokinase
MRYLLTLDVGTTAVKAGLFLENLNLVGFEIKEYALLTPKTDFVEMKPNIYWEKTKEAIDAILSKMKVDPADIASITCTTQGETLIPLGKEGKHLSNAIVWLDSRAKSEADFILEEFDKNTIYATTGLPEINGYCPIAKLLWIKNNLPDLYDTTEKFMLLEDYLIFKLSGKYVTNPALMCSTGYFNINTDSLWDEMLEYCGISREKLPEIIMSGRIVGAILPKVAKELNLSPNTVITSGAMDQVASAIGSGNIMIGTVTETTGTAQVVAATCEKVVPSKWSPVTVYRHAVDDKFLKIVINQTAGIAYKWFRNEFCIDLMNSGEDAFDFMGDLAAQEPELSRGLTFFPHLTGMQFPHSDESLRGVFFGIGLDTNRGCFIRAIMEGVGYMLRESIEAMDLNPDCIFSLGGGAKSQLWSQIKADICGTKIVVLENDESTSLGAAVLGCIALGIFNDFEKARDQILLKRQFDPVTEKQNIYQAGYAEYREMYKTFSPMFKNRR